MQPDSIVKDGAEQRWIIDSIEAPIASVEVDGTTMITVPLWLLPSGIGHGHILRVRREGLLSVERAVISFEIDEAATDAARAHSAAQVRKGERQANDPGGNIAF
jgi:hypothetical protein